MHARPRTLDQCIIRLGPTAATTAGDKLIVLSDFFGAAVFLQGRCGGARIIDCGGVSEFAPPWTPIAANTKVASPAALETFNRLLEVHLAPTLSLSESSPPRTLAASVSSPTVSLPSG